MKLKLGQLVSPPFTVSLRKLVNAEIPILTAWDLKTVVGVVETEQVKFEELRRKLIEKHAEKDENGEIKKDERGTIRVDPAKIEEFGKEIDQLLEIEIELQAFKLADFGKKVDLSAKDLINLDGLVTK